MMSEVGLPEKAHTRSHALSGGMKRKLSVGCALIGTQRGANPADPADRVGCDEL